MLRQDIVDRLREHAGLTISEGDSHLNDFMFIAQIQQIEQGGEASELDNAVIDVLECLQRINAHALSTLEECSTILTSDVAYAVSGMIATALEASLRLRSLGRDCAKTLKAAWKINFAWDQLLAGDIEDILQELKYAEQASDFI